MFESMKALVLREVHYKESDRILSLYTDKYGLITAKARGALKKNSRSAAGTQVLTYSDMSLFEKQGRYTVNECAVIEGFEGLRRDIEAFALGSYLAQCVELLTLEGQPEPGVLQLILNCLYALSKNMYPQEKIKAAFELRLMSLVGYAPETGHCVICRGESGSEPWLSPESGGVVCDKCRGRMKYSAPPLTEKSFAGLRHICSCPPKQILAFDIEGRDMKALSLAAEQYILRCGERSFPTLDYWKKFRITQDKV